MKKTYLRPGRHLYCLVIRMAVITALLIGRVPAIYAQHAPFPLKPVDQQRVQEIERMLPDKPAGFGEPCSNRDVWDKLLKSGKYDTFLQEMKTYTFPPFSKEDYFSLSDGSASSSGRGLSMMRKRAEGLSKVTWAECLENKNRYTRMVEDGLRAIIDQKSWVSPRSDYGFKNYKGIAYSVELTSSLYAHTIAQTLYRSACLRISIAMRIPFHRPHHAQFAQQTHYTLRICCLSLPSKSNACCSILHNMKE